MATLSSQSAEINERLASLAIDAAAAAANGAGNVHEALSERIAAFDHIVNQRAVTLVEAVSQQTERMREYLQALDGLVGESGHNVIDRLGSHSNELNARIAGHLDAIDVMMQARRDDFEKRFADHREQLATKSAERLEQFEIASAAHHNAVDVALADALAPRRDFARRRACAVRRHNGRARTRNRRAN